MDLRKQSVPSRHNFPYRDFAGKHRLGSMWRWQGVHVHGKTCLVAGCPDLLPGLERVPGFWLPWCDTHNTVSPACEVDHPGECVPRAAFIVQPGRESEHDA